MARTLPWLKATLKKDKQPRTSPPPSRRVDARPVKRQRVPSPEHNDSDIDVLDDVPGPQSSKVNVVAPTQDQGREPSSSPVPAAPDIVFMNQHDDNWIMVEDEFYTTAQLFTRHLHHEEYKRLKHRMVRKTEDPNAMLGGPASIEAQKRKLNAEQIVRKRGGEVGKRDSDSEDAGDDVIIEDRKLAGLMFANGTDTRIRTKLNGVLGTRLASNTRAAAGFGKQGDEPRKVASNLQSWCPEMARPHQVGGSSATSLAAPTRSAVTASDVDDEDDDLDSGLSHIATTSRRGPLGPEQSSVSKNSQSSVLQQTAPPLAPRNSSAAKPAVLQPESRVSLTHPHNDRTSTSSAAAKPTATSPTPRAKVIALNDDDDFPVRPRADPKLDEWRKARALKKAARASTNP